MGKENITLEVRRAIMFIENRKAGDIDGVMNVMVESESETANEWIWKVCWKHGKVAMYLTTG